MAQAVIMAGGRGERFWPLTHEAFPKYLIRLNGGASLLQKTYRRLLRSYPKKNIHVITTRDHFALIRKEIPKLKRSNILIEPFRKNTTAAILLACILLGKRFGREEVVSFFPADHLIENEHSFQKTMKDAISLARHKEMLVTVGIKPSFPATGYGYIQSGNLIPKSPKAYRVLRFREKPTQRVAQRYLRAKNFFWNGGIFTWRIGVFLRTMENFAPQILDLFDIQRLKKSYQRLPKLSIDYALLEKADNLAVVKTSMDWCDFGNWAAYLEKARLDNNKNFVHGNSHCKESSESLLVNHQPSPLVALGIRGLIVVQTNQGTLVCHRTRSEEAALFLKRGRW